MDKDEMRKDLEKQERKLLDQIKRLEGRGEPAVGSDEGGPTPRQPLAQARDMLVMVRKALEDIS